MIDNPLDTKEMRAEIHEMKVNLNSGLPLDIPRLMNWLMCREDAPISLKKRQDSGVTNYKV